jgi:hypothetical protein
MSQIWRYEWLSKSFERLVSREFSGDVFGNFARDDILGHITRNVTGEYFVYVLDIVTLREANITIDTPANVCVSPFIFQNGLSYRLAADAFISVRTHYSKLPLLLL